MSLTLIRLARRIVGLVGIALFAVLVAFSLFTHLAPLTGRQLFVISGGSMEPSVPLGSMVVVTPADAMTIAVGDVVTIRADNGVVITHRVMRVVDQADGRFFEMKGDANPNPDAVLVPARAIVGAANQYVPFGGYAREYLSSAVGLVAAVVVLMALFLIHVLLEALERSVRRIPAGARQSIEPWST
jgi:signal peptidase I